MQKIFEQAQVKINKGIVLNDWEKIPRDFI